jgi:hypothetical protein
VTRKLSVFVRFHAPLQKDNGYNNEILQALLVVDPIFYHRLYFVIEFSKIKNRFVDCNEAVLWMKGIKQSVFFNTFSLNTILISIVKV